MLGNMISFILCFSVVTFYGVLCMPEQGVRTLDLIENSEIGGVVGGISKSMYSGSSLSVQMSCTKPGEKIKVDWYMRTLRCAESYQIYDSDDMNLLMAVVNQFKDEIDVGELDSFPGDFHYLIGSQEVTCADKPVALLSSKEQKWQFKVVTPTAIAPTKEESSTKDANNEDSSKDAQEPKTAVKSSPETKKTESESTAKTRRSAGERSKRDASADDKEKPVKNAEAVGNQTSVVKAQPDMLVTVPVDGMYVFVLTASFDLTKVNLTVTAKAASSYGYLSAIDFPLLPFYAVMCTVFSISLLVWMILCCYYRKDILQIQLWIGAVLFIGFVDEASFLGEYHTINQTGQSVPGAILFGELVWCTKRSLARMVVIIASVGFGIVKPRLGPTLPKVIGVGVLYFVISAIDGYKRATTHKANQQTTGTLAILLTLSVTDAAICWWIFTALVQTMRTLRLRRNLVKLSLYRHFTNTLIFCVLASIGFMIWTIVQHNRATCMTAWKELWVDDAFWHLLFTIILIVMLILWRPSANNQRYAYSPLSDGTEEDAEEPMMNEAFGGMKMRGSKEGGVSTKRTSDDADDDLKWIEENIPSSVADSALPSLLDSEEEIMTTKYELSKMQ